MARLWLGYSDCYRLAIASEVEVEEELEVETEQETEKEKEQNNRLKFYLKTMSIDSYI